MKLDELQVIIQAAGGVPNALAYAEPLLTKINVLASEIASRDFDG